MARSESYWITKVILNPQKLAAVTGQIFVAYSGGCDSHVLLHILNEQLDIDLQAVHINHGLSPNADAWQDHVESVCDALSIPVRVFKVEVSREGSLETNARDARYKVFEALLGPDDVIVMAHHLDDQVETVLLNMMSGRAPFGLQGMPDSRPLGLGRVERPLIDVGRQQIRDYAIQNNLGWVEDESNMDTQHDRNYLRQSVLPMLEARWPKMRTSLLKQLARTNAQASQQNERAEQLFNSLCVSSDCINGEKFSALLVGDALLLLRFWLVKIGVKNVPGLSTLETAVKILQGDGSNSFELDDWYLQKCQTRIVLVNRAMLDHHLITTNIVKGKGITLPPGQFQIRPRREGDKLFLNGHHQSLKNIFQGSGVPSMVRDHIPVICDGEQPIAIAGIARWQIEMVVGDAARATGQNEGCEVDWTVESIRISD